MRTLSKSRAAKLAESELVDLQAVVDEITDVLAEFEDADLERREELSSDLQDHLTEAGNVLLRAMEVVSDKREVTV
jgi:hypothetical protein